MADGMDPGLGAIHRKGKVEHIHPDPLSLTVVGLGKGHLRIYQPKPVPDQAQGRMLVLNDTDRDIS